MPHYVTLGHVVVSQTLVAWVLGTLFFWLFVGLYRFWKKKYPYGKFVQAINFIYESIYNFFEQIWWGGLWPDALMFSCMIFMYVLRNNLFWLFGDMIVLVWPTGHHYFRPSTTDISFNALLAIAAVMGSIFYGFYKHWFHFIGKYFPHNGMWIVPKVTERWMVFTKFLDILLWLLIGLIELIGEFGRMMSLSLRLFWNMFVGMILLWLLIGTTQRLFHVPIFLPLFIFFYELCVALLQAFIFALLTTIYFRLSADHH